MLSRMVLLLAAFIPHGTALAVEPVQRLLTTDAQRRRVAAVKHAGIELDRYAMVVPSAKPRALERKIVRNLENVWAQVAQARRQGKHVIYFPGSYDLVHVGHASYILEGIQQYLERHPNLTRNDLLVVVLADDDELIRVVKPPHLAGIKDEHPRPIECFEMFEHATAHPRLEDLATLPVDVVGYLPAPTRLARLMESGTFRDWLATDARFPTGWDTQQSAHLAREAVGRYHRMLDALRDGQGIVQIKADFQREKYGLTRPGDPIWTVEAWQLMLHKFLGSVPATEGEYNRVISTHDVKYKDIVAALMGISRIDHTIVDDTHVLSTTDLVNAFGWQDLLEAKLAGFEARLEL